MTQKEILQNGNAPVINFGEALNAATRQAMELDPSVFVFGLGVDSKAGVFGSTKGLAEQFGEKRIFDTPVSEQALTSMAAGAANSGLRPILIHQRLDFMLYTMDQIVNWISLWHFKSSGASKMPLTIRMIVGKGWGQGPQHAKSLHTWFAHIPGLKVVVPGSPADAKGLLFSSIMSDDPVLFIESRSLYSMEEEVPEAPFMTPFGEALIRKEGHDVTIATFGAMVPHALQAAELLKADGIEAEIIDLRTLAPLDINSVIQSVGKTKNLVVVEPGWRHFGAAAEIITGVCESIGPELKSAPVRVTWPHSHVPTSAPLEKEFYPDANDIVLACKKQI